MSFTEYLNSAGRLLYDRPAAVIPTYLLFAGIFSAARVPLFVTLGIAAALLVAGGQLEALVAELEELDPAAFEPDPGDPEAVEPDPEAIPPGLEEALANVFTPEVVGLVLLGILGSVLVAIVARGLSNAATLTAMYAGLEGNDVVRGAVDGLADRWRSFVALSVVEVLLLFVAATPIFLSLLVLAGAPAAGLLLLLLAIPISGLLAIAVFLGLAFAGQAIVVDDVGVGGGIRRGLRLIVDRPVAFAGYVVVLVGLLIGYAMLSGVLTLLGISRVIGLVGLFVALPFLDTFKLSLYADREYVSKYRAARPAGDDRVVQTDGGDRSDEEDESPDEQFEWVVEEPPDGDGVKRSDRDADSIAEASDDRPRREATVERPGVLDRLRTTFSDGMRTMGRFVLEHPLAHLLSIAVFAIGVALGFFVTAGIDVPMEGPEDIAGIFGVFPVDVFVTIAANNWLVGATAAFGGIVLGIPTAVSLLFNGALVGGIYGLSEPIVFIALVAPHGVIELPAIFVATAGGFYLAGVTIGAIRGTVGREDVADALRLLFGVMMGLAVVFVVAAFVEAFLTPLIGAAILG